MGSLLKASCPCGYESPTIPAGGGFADFQTVCSIPAVCPTCKEVVAINVMKADTTCSKCGGETSLCGGFTSPDAKPDRVVFDWNVTPNESYVLEDRPCRCPKCGEMKMRFRQEGCWD